MPSGTHRSNSGSLLRTLALLMAMVVCPSANASDFPFGEPPPPAPANPAGQDDDTVPDADPSPAPPAETPPDTPPERNTAPTIQGTAPTRIAAGIRYAFTPSASDADDDPLVFAISGQPAWATFDATTGALAGTPTVDDVGDYPRITISVSDGQATASLPAFSVRVEAGSTGSVSLGWTPPTERIDGSPLTNLAGYRLFYGQRSGRYVNEIRVDNPGITHYLVENLTPGYWYFAIKAVDASGLESSYSAEIRRPAG